MKAEFAKKPGCLGILATALFVILISWCFWLQLEIKEIKYRGARWDHRTESSFWSIVDLEDRVDELEARIKFLEQQAEQGGDINGND